MYHLSRQSASSIHYLPSLELVYLNNPKAGCSTVRRSLWQAHDSRTGTSTYKGTPHRKEGSPFRNDPRHLSMMVDELRSAKWFSLVRNPYARVLSAYLDKFRPNGDPNVIRPFRKRYGWTKRSLPTFPEFLRIIAADSPESLDHHFRPQTNLLLVPYTPLDFVGCVERMDAAERWMNSVCPEITISDHRPHATDASQKILDHYDTAAAAQVLEIYGKDFEIFGYSQDPAVAAPVSDVEVDATDAVFEYLQSMFGDPKSRRDALGRLGKSLPRPRPPWYAQHVISTGLGDDPRTAVAEVIASSQSSWRTLKTLAVALAGSNNFQLAIRALTEAGHRYARAPAEAAQILGDPSATERLAGLEPSIPTWFYEAGFSQERIEAGDHRIATGGLWEEIGFQQLEYLIRLGLDPSHRLLDLGCGPLRGGVRFVKYLDAGNYFGIDVNRDLLAAGRWELASIGLDQKLPAANLRVGADFDATPFATRFDFVLAQALFPHLSLNLIRLALVQSAKVLTDDGTIVATYFRRPDGADPIQTLTNHVGVATHCDREPYDQTRSDLEAAAQLAGLEFRTATDWNHPAGQIVALFTKPKL